MSSFIITVDTESDNQWDTSNLQTTENAKYIPRFQELCEKFGFKPVYLVDYSMANDDLLVEYLNDSHIRNNSEIGMHLHAWDTPPLYSLNAHYNGRPYLIEYPEKIIEDKVKVLNDLLVRRFERKIISHRAGRWAINEFYINCLQELDYKVDCSITPSIDWSEQKGETCGGSNYASEEMAIHLYKESKILEVPMTVCKLRGTKITKDRGIVRMAKDAVKSCIGNNVWFRPAIFCNQDLKKLIEYNVSKESEYVEMMIHSSELMPGGSPYFRDDKAIEELYHRLEELFTFLKKLQFEGKTLNEIYEMKRMIIDGI